MYLICGCLYCKGWINIKAALRPMMQKNYPELFCLSRKFEKTGSVNKQKFIPNISLRNAAITGFLWCIRDNLTFGITSITPNSGQKRQAMQSSVRLRILAGIRSRYSCQNACWWHVPKPLRSSPAVMAARSVGTLKTENRRNPIAVTSAIPSAVPVR